MVWADPKGNMSVQLMLMFFPQLDHDCPVLPMADLFLPTEGLGELKDGPARTWLPEPIVRALMMPSELPQTPLGYSYPKLPLTAKVKIAECPENGYSGVCWLALRGTDAEIPSLWGHP